MFGDDRLAWSRAPSRADFPDAGGPSRTTLSGVMESSEEKR